VTLTAHDTEFCLTMNAVLIVASIAMLSNLTYEYHMHGFVMLIMDMF